MTNKKFKKEHIVSAILSIPNVAVIAFIFVHSLSPAVESAEESGEVLGLLNYIFPFELSQHIVRKLAHFVEFSGLGFITSLTVYSFTKKYFGGIFLKLFLCLATAVADESIQLCVEGRSGQITDVLLDFSGCIFGILLTLLIILIFNGIRKGNKNGKHQGK